MFGLFYCEGLYVTHYQYVINILKMEENLIEWS